MSELAGDLTDVLTKRWYGLKPVPQQVALEESTARFRVCPAGRRSGKTERAKRFLCLGDPENGFPGALTYDRPFGDGWFFASAPTHYQAKRIFWKDMQSFVPKWAVRKTNVTELTLHLVNGVDLSIVGMDKPERIEGRPIDGCLLDEFANMKPDAWDKHVEPGLSTLGRLGWAWLTGVPEGRNHYYDLFMYALHSGDPQWSGHTWWSEEVLDAAEIAAKKRRMDPMTFDQEYRGSFVNFAGRAYYSFTDDNLGHTLYDRNADLNICFDFNTAPGVAVICQEHSKSMYKGLPDNIADTFTAVLGEVYIPLHSNTPRVCRKVIADWGTHPGRVVAYGDATGGAKGTSAVDGSDWDIIDTHMHRHFGERYLNAVPHSNPRERVRVNAMNARCQTEDGTISLLLDKRYAKFTQKDFEGVTTLDGTNGEIDKNSDKALTHLTDALGYYIVAEHPIGGAGMEVF